MLLKMAPCSCSICEFYGISEASNIRTLMDLLFRAYKSSDPSWSYRYVMFSDIVREPLPDRLYSGRNSVGMLHDFLVERNLIRVVWDSGVQKNPNTGNPIRTVLGEIHTTDSFWRDIEEWLNPAKKGS